MGLFVVLLDRCGVVVCKYASLLLVDGKTRCTHGDVSCIGVIKAKELLKKTAQGSGLLLTSFCVRMFDTPVK